MIPRSPVHTHGASIPDLTLASDMRLRPFLGHPVVQTIMLALGMVALLEWYRPLFFLIDDNLVGVFPLYTEINERLWAGQWPFLLDRVFGGNFDVTRDPGIFGVLGPWNILWSWLSITPFRNALIDAIAISNVLATAACFTWAARWLNDEFALDLQNSLLVALGVSYALTPYNLLIGANWLGFTNAQAGLPLALVGMLHPRTRHGIAYIVAATLYALFGGHAHVFTIFCMVLGLLALALAFTRHGRAPLQRLLSAALLVVLVTFPLLRHAISGMRGTARFDGLAVETASRGSIDALTQLMSFVIGPVTTLGAALLGAPADDLTRLFTRVCFSAVGLLAAYGMLRAARTRAVDPMILVLGGVILCFVLWIARPVWLGHVTARVPLLRSLRWPVREVWVVVALLHLLVLWSSRGLAPPTQRQWLVLGGVMVTMLTFPLDALNEFTIDRRLIRNGTAARYWTTLQRETGIAQPRVMVGADTVLLKPGFRALPHVLLGTFNLPALFHVTSESGYSIIPAVRAASGRVPLQPVSYTGAFKVADAARVARTMPDTWLVVLEQLNPVEWTVHTQQAVRRFRYLPDSDRVVDLGGTPIERRRAGAL